MSERRSGWPAASAPMVSGVEPFAFEMPLPPAALSPNGRENRWVRSAAARAYKLVAQNRAAEALRRQGAPVLPVGLALTLVMRTRERRDLDNLLASCKSLIDGIVAAGVLPDDSAEQVRCIIVNRRLAPGMREPYLLVRLIGSEG